MQRRGRRRGRRGPTSPRRTPSASRALEHVGAVGAGQHRASRRSACRSASPPRRRTRRRRAARARRRLRRAGRATAASAETTPSAPSNAPPSGTVSRCEPAADEPVRRRGGSVSQRLPAASCAACERRPRPRPRRSTTPPPRRAAAPTTAARVQPCGPRPTAATRVGRPRARHGSASLPALRSSTAAAPSTDGVVRGAGLATTGCARPEASSAFRTSRRAPVSGSSAA